MAPRERRRVRREHDGGTARKRTEKQTRDGVYVVHMMVHVAALVSPSEPTEEQGMWDRGGLHPMDEDEKMDEDKEEIDSEETVAEDQEEEHQKARAIASPTLPCRREVEDHNLTHIQSRIWWNHCLTGRGREECKEETQ